MQTQKWIRDLKACRDEDELDQNVDAIINYCVENKTVPFLSDLILGIHEGAQPLMIVLGERSESEIDIEESERFRWKIKVMRDEWGNEPSPGDIVERKMQVNMYKKEGKPVPSTELSQAKANGSYDKKYSKIINYTVDKKGCITCGFRDAVYFLNNYGVHAKTNYALMTKNETSSEPCVTPDGKKLHVWYWRYKEMDSEDYKNLPEIKNSKDKKRGYDSGN